jgi:hypothetical protein
MASADNPPSTTTGAFELPPSAATAIQNRKEVSWSPTTSQQDGKTTEIRLFPVKYQIQANLSILTVLKKTLLMFQATDSAVYIVSRVNSDVIIRQAGDFDTFSAAKLQELFPAKIVNGQANLRMFMASTMTITRLKKSSYGYYDYASPKIWISDDLFESSDIRNFGFIIRKDPNRIDRDIFTKELHKSLSEFLLSNDDKQRLEEAQDNLPFPGRIPKFQARISRHISITSSSGKVSTAALTLHCDALHVNFLNKLVTRYYDESDTDEKFVPHSMLHGRDPDFLQAYRNAIVFQNQYLANVRMLPVIGLHPKAMKAILQLGEEEPAEVITLIRRYPYFTSIEPTNTSESLGKYYFVTTHEHYDQAKNFITETLPQIWQLLDETFLDELPDSVRCPRLTSSNLKDDSTRRTVAMLHNYQVPDESTIASKWSAPPQINRPPTSVSVRNYSSQDFPALPKQPHKSALRKTGGSVNSRNESDPHNIETTSTHSNASAVSAGTSFTRDECTSLFTTLTESIVGRFELQMATQNNAMIAFQLAQAERENKQDLKFEKMMEAFMCLLPAVQKKTSKRERKAKKKAPSPPLRERPIPSDTPTDPTNRPMEESETDAEPADDEDSRHENGASSDNTPSISSADTYNIFDEDGRRRTAENHNLLQNDYSETDTVIPDDSFDTLPDLANDTAPVSDSTSGLELLEGAPATEPLGTDDEHEWRGTDLFEGVNSITPTHNSNNNARPRNKPSTTTIDTHELPKIQTDTSKAEDEEDNASDAPSFATVWSDDPARREISQLANTTSSPTRNGPPALPDSPVTPKVTRKKFKDVPDKSFRHAVDMQAARNTALIPASILSPPTDLPWNVVSAHKRKAKESPSRPDLANTIRKAPIKGQTPKKLFLKPAPPNQEAPAPEK